MTSSADKRRAAFRHGLLAEELAALMLRLKGYRILARRFRTGRGEIDLIVRRGDTVAFVEVKARARIDLAIEAVGTGTRRRIIDAARIWISRNTENPNSVYRFDIVVVVPWRLPRHLENAFEGG